MNDAVKRIIERRSGIGGTWVKSPMAIVDETDTVNSFIKTLNDRVTEGSSPADYEFRGTWIEFFKEWLRWRAKHKYSDIWGKFGSWGPYWDKLQEFKRRAYKWLSDFEAIGGKTVLSIPPEAPEETSILKTALWGSIILGGIYVGTKVYEQIK